MSNHRSFRIPRAAVAAALLAACAFGAFAQGQAEDPRQDALAAAREHALLSMKLDLAKQEGFYLILDAEAGRLILMLKGAELRDWKFAGLEVGFPSVVYKKKRPAEEWQGRVWEKATLDPPRQIDRYVIVAQAPTTEGNEADIPIPPTPEEKYPVPARYHIRFEGGLSMELRTTAVDPTLPLKERLKASYDHWLIDAKDALGEGSGDVVRLRLNMSPDEAKSLFRALPPDVKLLILPRS